MSIFIFYTPGLWVLRRLAALPEDADLDNELLQLVDLVPGPVLPDQVADLEEADEPTTQE